MKAATQQQADAFTRHMAQRFRCTVIRKQSAMEMQWLAAAFDVARRFNLPVPSGEDFLEHAATTIAWLVYLPDGLTPDQQIETLTHECQHVSQFWTHGLGLPGGPSFMWLYVVEPEARVRYEVEAYRTGLELGHARGAPLPDLDALAFPLEGGYALNAGHVQLGRDLLEVAATSAKLGLVSTEAARAAIDWLQAHAPDLLAGG
jgi:hypothetical protein